MSRLPRPVRAVMTATLTASVAATFLSACGGEQESRPGAEVAPPASSDTASAPAPAPHFARYVALGDSFAAFGPVSASTSGPPTCFRSSADYPAVLARDPRIGALVDVTCGGAEIGDFTARQIDATPPQFDALTPDTDLVTLTIGGNDIGYGDIVDCMVDTPRVAPGSPCRDGLETEVSAALDGLPGHLDAMYAEIRRLSPRATILATRYLPLVPADGGCDFVSRISPGDVVWARDVVATLDRTVVSAADRAGVPAVLPDDADARSACAPAAERYTDFTGLETDSHPMHPTARGQEAMSAALAAHLPR